MCIAVLTTEDKVVPTDILTRCFNGNKDGAGFAYIDPHEQKVVIDKGYFKLDDFLNKYDDLLGKGANKKPMLIHARIATMGKVGRDNCHPFRIRNGALIHNGTLWYGGGRNLEKSDTREFAEQAHNILTYEDLSVNIKRVSQAIGSYNKVAMLYEDGKYIILNEEQGTWQDGVWYSNDYQLRRPTNYNIRNS